MSHDDPTTGDLNNDNLHQMLNDAGSRWRRSQPRPATADLSFATSRPLARWLPVAAAAATVGVATAAVLLAGSTNGGARQHPTPGSSPSGGATPAATTPPSAPAPTPANTAPPVPAGFAADDLSFLSATEGWALGSSGVLHTTDGGAHWRLLPGRPAGATHLRFASTTLGFAYGDIAHPVFDVTTDGGASWSSASGSSTEALEPGAGGTLRVVRDPSCSPPGCPYTIEAAPVGSAVFHPVSTPQLRGNAAALARQGSDAYVLVFLNPAGGAGDAHPTFAVSHDRGATWSTRPDPCGPSAPNAPNESDAAALSAAPGGLVAVMCVDRSGQSGGRLMMSDDAASTFARSTSLPAGSPVPALALADAAHVSLVVLIHGEQCLMSSSDSGKHWQKAAAQRDSDPVSRSGFLAFTTGTVGSWIGPDQTVLYRTADAGVTWRRAGFTG